MFNKKLPACAAVAAVTVISVPSVASAIIKLIMNSEKIVKAAKDVKQSVDNANKLSKELTGQLSKNQNVSDENETVPVTEEVISDMG